MSSASSSFVDFNVEGEKAITIEFWFCPTREICNGTYDDYAVIFSKINRAIQNVCGEWISDDFSIGFHPGDPDCSSPGAPLIFATHTFTGNCYNDTNKSSCEDDCNPCISDYNVVASEKYAWQPGEWHHVACTWGPNGSARNRRIEIIVDADRNPTFGATTTEAEIMGDGNLHNFLIGNHVKTATPSRAVDCLISQLRISNRVRTITEITESYNGGAGKVLEIDEHTLGLYAFDEGEGAYAFNDLSLQDSNFPTYGEEGALVTGPAKEYTQALLGESSSSAGSNEFGTTRAALFNRSAEDYLNVGEGPFLSLPILNTKTVNKFTMAAFVKRQSLGTFQTLVSKWCENDRKQFSISFNEDNKVEVRLGTQGELIRTVCETVEDNAFGTVEITRGGTFDGTYVTEEGYPGSSSSGAAPFVRVEGAGFEEANGDYVTAAGWAELNPGYASDTFPYVEVTGAADSDLDGLYYKQTEWELLKGISASSSSTAVSASSSSAGAPFLIVGAGAVGAPSADVEGTYELTELTSLGLPVWVRTGPDLTVPPAASSSLSSTSSSSVSASSTSMSSTSMSSSSTEPTNVYIYRTDQWSGGFTSWVMSTALPDDFSVDTVLYWFSDRPALDVFGELPPPYWYPFTATGDGPGLDYYDSSGELLTEDQVIVSGAGYDFLDGPYVQNGLASQCGEYYWKLYDELVTTQIPPEDGWESTLLEGEPAPTFTYVPGSTTEVVTDFSNLVWEIDGRPIWRQLDDPDAVIYSDVLEWADDGWDTTLHWWMGFGLGHTDDRAWGIYLPDELPPEVWYPRSASTDDPAPRAAIHPLVFTQEGTDVWRHIDRPYMAICRDLDTRVDPIFVGWFIGIGTRRLQYNYASYVVDTKTEDTPPNRWFTYESGEPPTLVRYPLTWEVDGVPVYRNIDDPLKVLFRDSSPFVDGTFWWISHGFDHLALAYMAIDAGCESLDYTPVPTDWLDLVEGGIQSDIEVVHTPAMATIATEVVEVVTPAGAEHVTTISADVIDDTDTFHQIVVTWFSEANEGKPRVYIDGQEVSGYDMNEPLLTDLPYLDPDGEVRTDWADFNIGRDAGVLDGVVEPGNYLDAILDEVILWATDLIAAEIEPLYAHATTGLVDGDRWMITLGSDRVYDEDTKRWQFDPAEGDWAGHDYEIVEWRRSPVTGFYDWIFLPVNVSAVYYNIQAARLESWLPDEFYERFGDFGAVGTGAFSIG
jgi:hypothetical protein